MIASTVETMLDLKQDILKVFNGRPLTANEVVGQMGKRSGVDRIFQALDDLVGDGVLEGVRRLGTTSYKLPKPDISSGNGHKAGHRMSGE